MNRPLIAYPGFADIVRQRSFWGVCAGHFSTVYLLYFMLTLLPFYLVRERHLSMPSMIQIASAYYAIEALSTITTGCISDFFIRKGSTPTRVRKSAMAIGHTLAAVALMGCALAASQWYLVCLVAVGIGSGTAGMGTFAFSQTLAAPPRHRKMDGTTKRLRKPRGCRGPGAHWISSGPGRKLSGTTRDRRCGVGGWRCLVGVCGRPSRTSELEISAAPSTGGGL
jgi:MFS transporter, ACS family, D-galactonate transporter